MRFINKLAASLSLLLLLVGHANAQQTQSNAQQKVQEPLKPSEIIKDSVNDSADKKALRELVAQITSFEAQFDQQVKDVDGTNLMEGKGKVYLAQPALIRWHAITPDENIMISDGDTLWVHNIDLEQVTAMTAKNAIESTPFALLTSKDDVLWQGYSVNKKGDEYQISPIVPKGQVKQLNVVLDKQQFKQLTIVDVSGQKSLFTFVDSRHNHKVDGELFKFVIPKDVELDDQRQMDHK